MDKSGGGDRPKDVFYDVIETDRYTDAAERTGVQLELTRRALHWMVAGAAPFKHGIPAAPLLLDIGVGAAAPPPRVRRTRARSFSSHATVAVAAARCASPARWSVEPAHLQNGACVGAGVVGVCVGRLVGVLVGVGVGKLVGLYLRLNFLVAR